MLLILKEQILLDKIFFLMILENMQEILVVVMVFLPILQQESSFQLHLCFQNKYRYHVQKILIRI